VPTSRHPTLHLVGDLYNELSNDEKIILDATTSGAFTVKIYSEGYQILVKMTNNNTKLSNPRELVPKLLMEIQKH